MGTPARRANACAIRAEVLPWTAPRGLDPASARHADAMRTSWILVLLLLIVGLALAGSTLFVWRHVGVRSADAAAAVAAFERAHAGLGARATDPPLFRCDASGRVQPNPSAPIPHPAPLAHVRVLAFRAREGRLVHADVPFWFLKLKGPGAVVALRGTGVDLGKMGLTPRHLERQGPGLVLDERQPGGDRLMIWTD